MKLYDKINSLYKSKRYKSGQVAPHNAFQRDAAGCKALSCEDMRIHRASSAPKAFLQVDRGVLPARYSRSSDIFTYRDRLCEKTVN